ncbi:MAG: carbohydrate binding domain-containing protein [Desulfotomaculaceae bacterium]
MRGRRGKIWIAALVGALLIVMVYALTGCVATQTTGNSGAQPPSQTQTGQTGPEQLQQLPPQTTPSTVPDKTKTEKLPPILENATFEMGHFGWSPQDGTIVTEDNGNKCIKVGYTWGLYQFLQVQPGETYQIYCKVKQGSEPASPARMSVMFYDSDHKIMPESMSYLHSPGTEWSSFPKKVFTVPENALFTKLFILSHGKGTVCFDNVSVSLVQKEANATPGAAQQ